jgi:valyl-tRNA synthetase
MQWFVKIKSLSEIALNIVEDGKIRIIPDTWTKTYYEWMNNIKDWCISRQIWWGHRIPAWHCKKCGQITVEVVEPERCVNCGSSQLTQESDVLDTWFSSALWPFSTMGWPEDTALFKKFYPTNCLVTGFDILFFWVARMIMMGIEFTGLEPFKDVYIHALVRDIEGKKMSKSKGNIIDPLTLIEKYSADALRFTLSAMAAQGRDIKLSEERVEGYRNFMNKIWNATRFILSNTDELNIKFDIDFIEIEDKWILDRLSKAIFDSERFITNYEFDRAANTLYNFFWHEFCDWYIEFIKMRIYKNNKKIEALGVALYVLEKSLILMHPFMPFITEYIYKLITGRESVLLETFPSINYTFKEASELTEVLIEFISMVRNIRGEYDINPSKVIDIFVKTESKEIKALLEQKKELIGSIAKIGTVIYTDKLIEKAAISVSTNFQIFIPLKGIIDINAQLQRLKDEKENLIKDYNLLNGKLNNPAFLEKAPKNIIEKDTLHLKEVSERLSSIDEMLQKLKKLI